jgi:hypothetical protein|nr:MAG TPA: hypothetical protein [Crassvirales sp.]
MINNFKLIESLLSFNNPDLFYHVQIIRRGKDHPSLPSANRTIKTYHIDNAEYLHKHIQEIIDLCEYFKARAYINLAPKSYKKCTLQCISDMANRAKDGDFKKMHKCWNSVVGFIKSSDPHWVIDVDSPTDGTISEFIEYECEPLHYHMEGPHKVYDSKIYDYIPTKNGYHIITKPFNLNQFKEQYPNIDVHKNNPTILYIPKSLD